MQRSVPDDPVDHTEDFAGRYAVELDLVVSQIMLDLGICPSRIGMPDHAAGIVHAAFHPHERSCGAVSPDGRIIVDSSVLNLEVLDHAYGDAVGRL